MKITIYQNDSEHQKRWAKLFHKGLQVHGVRSSIKHVDSPDKEADISVIYSAHHKHIISLCESTKKDYIQLEAGFFGDRLNTLSAGWNGLNGRANFCNKKVDSTRKDKWDLKAANWNSGKDYILLTGQVPGDAAVENYVLVKVYQDIVDRIAKYSALPVRFRPHPKSSLKAPKGSTLIEGTLEEAFKNAWCTVTINSNTRVDSILAGAPCIVQDRGSMAWDVSSSDLSQVANPLLPDRESWLNRLAYCQWTPEEVEAGETWEHLKQYLN